MCTALRSLGLVLVAIGACAPDSSLPGQGRFCRPGITIFCRCPGGEPGTKACEANGAGFTSCALESGSSCPDRDEETTGEPGGFGPASSSSGEPIGGSGPGGGPPTGDGSLLSACSEGSDCETGLCPMGFCTRLCEAVSDCPSGFAECVDFAVDKLCLPTCGTLESPDPGACDEYGLSGQCGYAEAIDGWHVATCAAWGPLLETPPQGSDCDADVQCDLGHDGVEAVCSDAGICVHGCLDDHSCPSGESCSSSGSTVGKCL